MPDTVTEVTSRGWGSRLKGSFKGILVGILLILGACWFLFANEGRAVRRYKALNEGAGVVLSVSNDRVAGANQGKLVHTSGVAKAADDLVDREFGISVEAIHLERTVEMYQWQESSSSHTEKKAGGGTETTTTYSYAKGWSKNLIASSSFKEPRGHQNPVSMPFSSRSFTASEVSLGAFSLSPGLIRRMSNWEPLAVRSTADLPDAVRGRALIHADGLYLGTEPAKPRVGDLRISFRQVLPGPISVVAAQVGTSLSAYETRSGGSIELLQTGSVAADEMIAAARQANKVTTWAFRLAGFLMMMFGFRLSLGPLSVMADVWPALGNLVERGVSGVAVSLAAPLSLLVIALAWIFYRPLLAIGILALTGILLGLLMRRLRSARRQVAPPPPPPPPPAPPLTPSMSADS